MERNSRPLRRPRYGLPSAGSEETVAGLGVVDARAYWNDRLVPSNAIFWAVGDVDADALVPEVEALFGGLEDRPAPANTPPTPERVPEARRIVVVDKPELGQARIIVAREASREPSPSEFPDLMNDALGGSGFSSA